MFRKGSLLRLPDNDRDRALFADIFRDPYRAADAVRPTLLLDGDPVIPTSMVATSVVDAPAIALEATLPVSASRRLIRREARVILRIEGIRWVDYIGQVVIVSNNDDGTSNISASTPGYYQGGDDAIRFNENKSYFDTPSRALADMLGRLPYPHVKMPSIQKPMYVRQRETAFPPVATVGEALDDLETQAGIVVRDDWLSGAYARLTPSLGTLAAGHLPVWVKGEDIATFESELKNSGQFYDVGIVRQNPVTGDYEQLVTPRPRVRYPPGVPAPPKGSTYYEEITVAEEDDPSGDPTPTTTARQRAQMLAAGFSFGGEHNCTVGVPYLDPRIEEYDARDVKVVDYEMGTSERWRIMIEGQTKDYVATSVSYLSTGIVLERVEDEGPRKPTLRIGGSPIPTVEPDEPPDGEGIGWDDFVFDHADEFVYDHADEP